MFPQPADVIGGRSFDLDEFADALRREAGIRPGPTERAVPPEIDYGEGAPLGPNDFRLADLLRTHATGWPPGVAPTPGMVMRMLKKDLLFGAFRNDRRPRELSAALHARVLAAGRYIGACSVAETDGCVAEGPFRPPVTRSPTLFCHAAVTERSVQGGAVTQTLVITRVLPWLRGLDVSVPWYTTSPATYFVDSGRAAVTNAEAFQRLVTTCDAAVALARPLDCRSLSALLALAAPWLLRERLVADRASLANPAEFFASLYHQMPTHDELVLLRSNETPEGQASAQAAAERVERLYAPIEKGAHEAVHQSAAFGTIYLAAAMAQWGVRSASGRPIDSVQSFHAGNGAVLHPDIGPIADSRPADVAGWRFGQVLVYDRDRWEERRMSYRERVDGAKNRSDGAGDRRVRIEHRFFDEYLPRVAVRLAQILAVAGEGRAIEV